MIQTQDLRKGLRVIYKDMKGIIVKWEKQPDFTINFLTIPSKKVIGTTHVMLNTNENWINSPRESDRNIITWGCDSKKLNVDIDYYNNSK